MTIPTTNVTMSSIRTEFPGAATPIRMSQYYRGGALVPIGTMTSPVDGVPISTSGTIRIGMFRGVSKFQTSNHTLRSLNNLGFSSAGGSMTPVIFRGFTIDRLNYTDLGGSATYDFWLAKLGPDVINANFFTQIVFNGHTLLTSAAAFTNSTPNTFAKWTWTMANGSPFFANDVNYPVTITY